MVDSRCANHELFRRLTISSAIIDSRLGWTCQDGGFMNIGLGKDEEVAKWGKMKLPDTEPLRAKVDELENCGFRTNFTFTKQA